MLLMTCVEFFFSHRDGDKLPQLFPAFQKKIKAILVGILIQIIDKRCLKKVMQGWCVAELHQNKLTLCCCALSSEHWGGRGSSVDHSRMVCVILSALLHLATWLQLVQNTFKVWLLFFLKIRLQWNGLWNLREMQDGFDGRWKNIIS